MNLPFTKSKEAAHLLANADMRVHDIVCGCRKNNRNSQEQLFEWLKDYAAAVCYRYASHVIEVQDLVSDGFMKVYKNIDQYNHDKFGYSEASFKGWFKRVLINNCINYTKQHNNNYTILHVEEEFLAYQSVVEKSGIETINYKEILKYIKELPQSYKTVFSLFVIDGYSHEEIAQLLGISIGASKSNLFKAKQHLQKSIASF